MSVMKLLKPLNLPLRAESGTLILLEHLLHALIGKLYYMGISLACSYFSHCRTRVRATIATSGAAVLLQSHR